jgi:hypothetical protein
MSKTKPIKKPARSNQSLLLSDFLLGLLFDPADGDTFPRNVEELVTNYMALQARKS